MSQILQSLSYKVCSTLTPKFVAIDDYAKDGVPGRSDLDVVFTMILCATNFFILISYEAHIHKLASNSF